MLEVGRIYTLAGQGGVYIAEMLPDGRLFLRDLNRCQFWHCGWGARQGWAEGFLGRGAGGPGGLI